MTTENIRQPNEPDSSVTSALKVTLPENVFNDLTAYAEALSYSKSDVIKEAVRERISRDNAWNNRVYLFKKQSVSESDTILDLKKSLKMAKKGALVKVAVNRVDQPNNAGGWIFYLARYDNDFVYLELPILGVPSTTMDASTNDISLESGTLVVPMETSIQGVFGPNIQLTYKVPLSYVWNIECNPVLPSMSLNGIGYANLGNMY